MPIRRAPVRFIAASLRAVNNGTKPVGVAIRMNWGSSQTDVIQPVTLAPGQSEIFKVSGILSLAAVPPERMEVFSTGPVQ